MATIQELLARAAALREETALNSISPERAGGIMYDTIMAINELWLQQGSALVISKIYTSVAAMEADNDPVSDISGQPLRAGQIVVIASSESDNGSVYRFGGISEGASVWAIVGTIGGVPCVDSLDSDSTQLPLAAHQGKVLDGKISDVGQKMLYVFPNGFVLGSDFSYPAQYNTSGDTLVEQTISVYQYIDNNAQAGDIYVIYGYGANAARLWAFVDANNNIISKSVAGADRTVTPDIIVAPAGTVKAIFSGYSDYWNKIKLIKNGYYDKELYRIEHLIPEQQKSVLFGKKIHWCGDSIMAGTLFTADKRLPNLVDAQFGSISTNKSADGSLFYGPTWYVGQTRSILWQVKQAANDADYIIFQGGVNGVNMTDPEQQNYAPMGEMTNSYASAFDETTQIGTLEAICKYITQNLAGKKIGFIITYQISENYDSYVNYWKAKIDQFLPVLKKWGIPVLDWRESGINLAANAQYYGYDSYGNYQQFDPTASYNTDDRVIHDNKLYKANEPISPGAWNSSQWTQISSSRYDTWHCNELAYRLLSYKTAKWMESL